MDEIAQEEGESQRGTQANGLGELSEGRARKFEQKKSLFARGFLFALKNVGLLVILASVVIYYSTVKRSGVEQEYTQKVELYLHFATTNNLIFYYFGILQEQIALELPAYPDSEGRNMREIYGNDLKAQVPIIYGALDKLPGNEELKLNITNVFKKNLCEYALNIIALEIKVEKPQCQDALLNAGLDAVLIFIVENLQTNLQFIGKKHINDIFNSDAYIYIDWRSWDASDACEFIQKMIVKDYLAGVELQASKSRSETAMFILLAFSVVSQITICFFGGLSTISQAARNNLLLVTDTVLVSNENVMYQLFGEKRKQDMQRRQELARRFRMAR